MITKDQVLGTNGIKETQPLVLALVVPLTPSNPLNSWQMIPSFDHVVASSKCDDGPWIVHFNSSLNRTTRKGQVSVTFDAEANFIATDPHWRPFLVVLDCADPLTTDTATPTTPATPMPTGA